MSETVLKLAEDDTLCSKLILPVDKSSNCSVLFWRSLLAIEGDARQAGELLFVDVVNNDKRDKFSRKMFPSHEDETSLFMSGHSRIVSKDGCKISTSKDFPQHEQESK